MCLVSSILVTLMRVRAAVKAFKLALKHAEGAAAEEGSVVITEPEIGESDREGKVAVDSFYLLYLILLLSLCF